MKKLCAIFIIMLMLIITLTGCFANANDANAVITIKSEAIVELIIDERGRVVSIAPLNPSAEVAIIGLDIVNDSVSTAVRKLVLELLKLGYLNAVNKDISVDTLTLNADKAKMYNRTIFNAVKSINKSINILSYDFKIEERDHRSFVRNTSGYENLELLQYRLITNLMRYRSDMTYKQGARMSIDDLTQELIGKYAFSAQFHTFTLTKWVKNNINAKKLDYGIDISEILGGVFKQNYDSYFALKSLTSKIINNKIIEKLSIETVSQALNIIGINNDEEINQAYTAMSDNVHGYPTIGSLEVYIDNIFINRVFVNNTVQENFEKQIDKTKSFYKIDLIMLTEQEKRDIIELLPIAVNYQYLANIVTIEDVRYILKILVEKSNTSYKLQYDASGQEIRSQLDTLVNKINRATEDYVLEHKQLIDKEFERLDKEYRRRLETYKK